MSGAVTAPAMGERIVDVVFGASRRRRAPGTIAGLAVGAGAHGLLLLWASCGGPSLGSWAAEVALRVHRELGRTEAVELPKPLPAPAPEPEPPPPAREPAVAESQPTAQLPAPDHEHRATALHQPPAEAGPLAAVDDPLADADLTGNDFNVGEGAGFPGGRTSSGGTGKTPSDDARPRAQASASRSPAAPTPKAPDLSQSIAAAGEWNCAWPSEADAEQIDQQAAEIRVTVRADGSVEAATIASDPGFGFGRAAVACARSMQFTPARDREGRAVRSTASIRVHFWR